MTLTDEEVDDAVQAAYDMAHPNMGHITGPALWRVIYRAAYEQAVAATIERCAKAVDNLTEDADRATYEECAAAIRALAKD